MSRWKGAPNELFHGRSYRGRLVLRCGRAVAAPADVDPNIGGRAEFSGSIGQHSVKGVPLMVYGPGEVGAVRHTSCAVEDQDARAGAHSAGRYVFWVATAFKPGSSSLFNLMGHAQTTLAATSASATCGRIFQSHCASSSERWSVSSASAQV